MRHAPRALARAQSALLARERGESVVVRPARRVRGRPGLLRHAVARGVGAAASPRQRGEAQRLVRATRRLWRDARRGLRPQPARGGRREREDPGRGHRRARARRRGAGGGVGRRDVVGRRRRRHLGGGARTRRRRGGRRVRRHAQRHRLRRPRAGREQAGAHRPLRAADAAARKTQVQALGDARGGCRAEAFAGDGAAQSLGRGAASAAVGAAAARDRAEWAPAASVGDASMPPPPPAEKKNKAAAAQTEDADGSV